MCGQDQCVGMVKEMTAELFREHRELVQRLNLLQEHINSDDCLISKTRRKIEWMEEKERTVRRLKKIVVSLQDALEADVGHGDIAVKANHDSDELSDDDTASEVSGASRRPSEVCDSVHVTSMRHPRAFSRIFCAQPPQTESFVTRIQTELYTAFIANLDGGSIRLATPREERRILLEPPVTSVKLRPRALWLAQSDEGGQASVTARAASTWMSKSVKRLPSLPDLPKLAGVAFPREIPRRIHRMGTAVKNRLIGL